MFRLAHPARIHERSLQPEESRNKSELPAVSAGFPARRRRPGRKPGGAEHPDTIPRRRHRFRRPDCAAPLSYDTFAGECAGGNATVNAIDATFDGIDCDDGSGVRVPFSGRIRVTK
jgi:hypothetical protein